MTTPADSVREPPPVYLTPLQVAKLLGSTATTVTNWAKAGCRVNGTTVMLKCEFVGTRYRIKPEWVEEFKAACGQARGAALVAPMPPQHNPTAAERRAREVLADLENW